MCGALVEERAATSGTVAVVTRASRLSSKPNWPRTRRLVIVSRDGVRLYACEPCLEPARPRALANERVAAARPSGADSSARAAATREAPGAALGR